MMVVHGGKQLELSMVHVLSPGRGATRERHARVGQPFKIVCLGILLKMASGLCTKAKA